MSDIQIVSFDVGFAPDFARLNYEWIDQYFRVEDHDREMLDDPAHYIINEGGEIFFALAHNRVVGTVAMLRDGDDRFELAKMAVSPDHKGMGIGDRLMTTCIDFACRKGKSSIFLLSNTKLVPAINLYKKHGFVEVKMDKQTRYERVNIRMELALAGRKM